MPQEREHRTGTWRRTRGRKRERGLHDTVSHIEKSKTGTSNAEAEGRDVEANIQTLDGRRRRVQMRALSEARLRFFLSGPVSWERTSTHEEGERERANCRRESGEAAGGTERAANCYIKLPDR